MRVGALLRLLELVRRELPADDVRVEIGGREPSSEREIFCSLGDDHRLVASFEAPPADREQLRAHLEAFARSFVGGLGVIDFDAPGDRHELASRRLDDELESLADRAGAVRAVVIDTQSPVIWGTSGARRHEDDVETALHTARAAEQAARAGVDLAGLLERDDPAALLAERGVDRSTAHFLAEDVERIRNESRRSGSAWRHHLLTAHAIAALRAEPEPPQDLLVRDAALGLVVRSFASIYRLLLVFDGTFSELHAEAAALRALPLIERLVLALPPIDPGPRGGARVIDLHRAR
ncbi:MAG: hypothetical protein OZ921_09490 [Sorangiineae bacterium]|nr:hypothetical protein [Polyangiaceae bacterium]MEB2322736.1 hypothetical protein [Sorangiineae bacterium]